MFLSCFYVYSIFRWPHDREGCEVLLSSCLCVLFVCLSARIYQKPHIQSSRNLPYMLLVVAQFSLTTTQYVMCFVFVDDVMFPHNGAKTDTDHSISELIHRNSPGGVAELRSRRQSLLSSTALFLFRRFFHTYFWNRQMVGVFDYSGLDFLPVHLFACFCLVFKHITFVIAFTVVSLCRVYNVLWCGASLPVYNVVLMLQTWRIKDSFINPPFIHSVIYM